MFVGKYFGTDTEILIHSCVSYLTIIQFQKIMSKKENVNYMYLESSVR